MRKEKKTYNFEQDLEECANITRKLYGDNRRRIKTTDDNDDERE